MTILLTGKNGQLGFGLQRSLAPLGEVYAVDVQECDFADPARSVQPDLIINPAAGCQPDTQHFRSRTAGLAAWG